MSIITPLRTGSSAETEPLRTSRAALISEALKEMARKVERAPLTNLSGGWSTRDQWHRRLAMIAIISFAACVLLPALTSGVYLAFVRSGEYASEFRFAVRSGERDMVANGAAASVMKSAQDSMILYEYIQSRGIVEELQKSLDLRKLFTRSDIDFLSRLTSKSTIEDLLEYWQKQVSVSIDPVSGLITVVVRAFTPEDALKIAEGVIDASERLVNQLSDRSRNDSVMLAKSELVRAQDNLQRAISAVRDLRNSEQLFDAEKSADALTKMSSALRLELIKLEQDYAVQRSKNVSVDAPHLRVMEVRINSIKEQLQKLSSEITNGGSGSKEALADAMTRFERLKLEHSLAEQQYQSAAAVFERARMALASQFVYLATFLRPVLAEQDLYPKRFWLWSIIVLGSFVCWAIFLGVVVLVRNHVDLSFLSSYPR